MPQTETESRADQPARTARRQFPPSPRRARWRSPLLWLVLSAFAILNVSGFALFFARPWIASAGLLADIHIVLGVATLLPYGAYQIAHLRRVTGLKAQLHYKLGLWTMWSFVLSGLSGAWMVAPASSAIGLVHLMSSFAFLVFLTAHLIVVARLVITNGAGSK